MITVVSGLPRSGTSMMMQMLAAGGLPVLAESEHAADSYNPKGYFEWLRTKELQETPALIAAAEDKALKVFSPFLPFLSPDHEYRVLLMQRPLAEVLQSQAGMLCRDNKKDQPSADPTAIEEAFRWHLTNVDEWRETRPNMHFLRVDYHAVLREPEVIAKEIVVFLNRPLNTKAMAEQVDRGLHRTRLDEASPRDLSAPAGSRSDASQVDPAQAQFSQLMQRQVGFELFGVKASDLPEKTYVSIYGRYVLLGFSEQAQADEFFKTAIESTS